MKKILCLILCMIFVFSLTACKEKGQEEQKTAKHSVDVKKYIDAGEFDTVEYKLGDSVEKVREKLSVVTDDHGDSSFAEYPSADEKYVIMSAGEVFCRYEAEKEAAGICDIAINSGAFGFEKGTVSTAVRDAMKTIGYEATLRDVKDGEFFFIPKGANSSVLKYEFEKNNLAFIFDDSGLSFTVIYK